MQQNTEQSEEQRTHNREEKCESVNRDDLPPTRRPPWPPLASDAALLIHALGFGPRHHALGLAPLLSS
jgi:hypothetical protein